MELSPQFLQGVDVYAYVLCVCVYAHTHTLHVGYSDVSPGVGTRHLESPEEIQMYCSYRIHIYRAVYEVHMYIYMLGYREKSGLTAFLFSFNTFVLSQKRKEEYVSKPPISQI